MSKPFILICGAPHSFTSMVSKFLIDNGAYVKELWGETTKKFKYYRYEELETHNFVQKRKKFKKYDLTGYFNSIPKNKVVMAKEPGIVYFIKELAQFTNRKVKIIYVMRNPEQIIMSSMEKSKRSFIYYFEKIIWMYDFIVECDYEVLPFMAERIKEDGKRLLDFCELSPRKINYSSVRSMKKRKPTYLKYRFANFFWKRLSKFFRVFT